MMFLGNSVHDAGTLLDGAGERQAYNARHKTKGVKQSRALMCCGVRAFFFAVIRLRGQIRRRAAGAVRRPLTPAPLPCAAC